MLPIMSCSIKQTNKTNFKSVNRNYVEIIGHLADRGADVNIGRNDGYTPLRVAAELDHVETIKTLMEKGADVNRTVGESGVSGATPSTQPQSRIKQNENN